MQSSIHIIYEAYLQGGKVTTDTRKLTRGSIFFALTGPRFNGNRFAVRALEEGCSLAVVDDPALKGTDGCVWVPDVLEALQAVARYHRSLLQIPVIAVTGSNGKTTTKELLAAVLSKRYRVWSTQGNLNNHIGVPLTLLSIPPGTEIAVVEMGANHIGEIEALCHIARPDHGLITNIGKAHIEGFGSHEGVKQGKGELYRFLKDTGGELFVNTGDPVLLEMAGDYPFIGYGSGMEAVVSAAEAVADPLLSFRLKTSRVEGLPIQTHLTGLYNVDNFLAAAVVAHYFGVDETLVKAAFEGYVPRNHRSQYVETASNKVLMDAYNANPSSFAPALDNFFSMEHPRKVLIMGGMKELGDTSRREHKALIGKLTGNHFEACYLVGEEFEEWVPANERFKYFDSGEALREYLEKEPVAEALVLVKGSRANELERVLEVL